MERNAASCIRDGGKYSVILGAATEGGIPAEIFSAGKARWLGVTLGERAEEARTVLVAAPYALQASDAETLGGHPASDFMLNVNDGSGKSKAEPAGGTNITQINVGDGVTGGGTGPTVTLGLSSSYLESLGNEIFAQLGGANTLTGKNTFSAGKLFIGSSPVLSPTNVVAGSDITVTPSGNNVSIALNGSALLTLGNGFYAQLAAANTFAKAQTFQSAVTFASGQAFPGTVALSGNNTFSGSNTFSKAITFASGQTFPGTGSGTITGVTTTSPLTGGGTSGSVGLGLDTSALQTTLNGVYAQLGAANTFSKPITFASGQTFPGTGTVTGITAGTGILVSGSNAVSVAVDTNYLGANYAGLNAPNNTFFGDVNVLGVLSSGLQMEVDSTVDPAFNAYTIGAGATAIHALGDAYGVVGITNHGESGPSDAGVQGLVGGLSTFGGTVTGVFAGIWGDGGNEGQAVLGTNGSGVAGEFLNHDTDTVALYAYNFASSGNVFYAGGSGGDCEIGLAGNLACSGGVSVVGRDGEGRARESFTVTSPESWIEDFGSGQLSGGRVTVALEQTFASLVNTSVEYHVFLTPKGESGTLYVTGETANGFEVRETHGASNVAFDYRIVAKQRGKEQARLTDVTERELALLAQKPKLSDKPQASPVRPIRATLPARGAPKNVPKQK